MRAGAQNEGDRQLVGADGLRTGRSYRPPRSPRSLSSMTERSSCSACSTCPGAWPCSQLSATRALYLGPEGSGGDVLGCSGKAATRQGGSGIQRGDPRGSTGLTSRPLGSCRSVRVVAGNGNRRALRGHRRGSAVPSPIAPRTRQHRRYHPRAAGARRRASRPLLQRARRAAPEAGLWQALSGLRRRRTEDSNSAVRELTVYFNQATPCGRQGPGALT